MYPNLITCLEEPGFHLSITEPTKTMFDVIHFPFLFFFCWGLGVLEVEPRHSSMPGKWSAIELNS